MSSIQSEAAARLLVARIKAALDSVTAEFCSNRPKSEQPNEAQGANGKPEAKT